MPRISLLEPPYAPDVAQKLKAMMGGQDTDPLSIFRGFVSNMPLASAMGPLGAYFLRNGVAGGPSYDTRSRELVIDRVCARCGCEYEWGVHVAIFRKAARLTDEEIYATVHEDSKAACWDDRDAAVIEMVDNLHDTGHVPDSLFDSLLEHFSDQQISDLLMLAGWYHAISYFANGLKIEHEEWAPRFPQAGTE